MGGFQHAREFALSLPGATEEPHFDMSSFRVKGKIFATVPPGEEFLHVFVDEAEAETYVAEGPAAFAPLLWGQRARGLRVDLAAADDARLEELIRIAAWKPGTSGRGGNAAPLSACHARPGRCQRISLVSGKTNAAGRAVGAGNGADACGGAVRLRLGTARADIPGSGCQ